MKKFLTLLFSFCLLFGCDNEESIKEAPVVTKISFENESFALQIGSTTTLNVIHSPSDLAAPSYLWRSNNWSVARVSSTGSISALALGDATISVTTDAGLTTSCLITVVPIEASQITLSESALAMSVGDTHNLEYEILPDDTTDTSVTWSSSDNNIATVEDGVITAISEGVAQIKIESINGVSDICELSVSNVDVESIALSALELTIEETETTQLFATITPSNATNCEVVWTSSDASVATVDESGNIVGVKVGSTTITATTVDGGCSASCDVAVTEIKVKSVTLEWKSIKLAIGETYTLISTVSPYNAANKNVSWSSSSSNIVSVDANGGLSALSQGSATIYARSEDGNSYASCYVEVDTIDKYLVLDACIGNFSIGATSIFQLNDRLYNPTSLPIEIDSFFFIKDLPFEFATGYPGGDVISKGEYKYNLFEDNIYVSPTASVAWSDFATEVARYSMRYYISCNGESYVIEQSYDGYGAYNLNNTPTIKDWWE